MAFSSSRTFPGQSWLKIAFMASDEKGTPVRQAGQFIHHRQLFEPGVQLADLLVRPFLLYNRPDHVSDVRDELDILMTARQLDWGYVAYPPLTPFIARIGLELFGNSLQGLRLFSAIGQGVVMFLTGLIARDLGGKRPAQVT